MGWALKGLNCRYTGKGDRAAVLHVYLAQALALDAGRCTAKEYNQ